MEPVMNHALATLAVNGGPKIRTAPWPKRHLFGDAEKKAAMALFDQAMTTGDAFGYNGPEEAAYCAAFAEFMGGGFADAVNSGTTAVYVALRALELEPFSEVIVPPITDPGGVMPVPLMGCIPVPADAATDSFNTGAEQIAARLTPRTRAILVAHISGIPCDMNPIMELARTHGLPVVEDCAQAHGALYRGRPVGTFGDIGAFSTMFGKHHASGGQGGLVFTRDASLYQRVRWMSDRGKPFGLPPETGNVVAALNLNSDELSCAIGRVQLQKLPEILARRRCFAAALAQGCRSTLSAVRVVEPPADCQGAYWFMFLRLDTARLCCDKASFVQALAAEGIPCEAGYLHAPAIADWCRQHRVFGSSGFPWTHPQYRGDPDARYDLPNALAADAVHFRITPHENCGDSEVADTVAALAKVERAFLRVP
jgi:dTDP-4-amino-4,6-dideoxygalactose transaminase